MKNAIICLVTAVIIITAFILICKRNPQIDPFPAQIKALSDSLRNAQAKNDNLILALAEKDSLLKYKDTVIITKWQTKIKEIPTYQLPNFVNVFDTALNVPLYVFDTLGCLDKQGLQAVTVSIYEGFECAERLTNCSNRLEVKDSTIALLTDNYDLAKQEAKLFECLAITQTKEATKQSNRKRFWRKVAGVGWGVAVVSILLHF